MRRIVFATLALLVSATALSAATVAPSDAPFACTARTGVCHFRLFYAAGGGRIIWLPAGLKETVPDVRVGTDTYCVLVDQNPPWGCNRKTIRSNSNN